MNLQTFSAATLEHPAFFAVGVLDAPSQTPVEGDTNIIKGMKVFRSGTFTDSMGRTNEWTVEDLQSMVTNFSLLRGNPVTIDGEVTYDGPLPLVPQRLDHSKSIKDVIGYFTNVYLDPARPGFLFADVAITEPEHLARYRRGTYRNRSIEIGTYQDNFGNVYSPVVLGLAFVDLPAVEGLFSRNNGQPAGDQSPPAKTTNQGENMFTTIEEAQAAYDAEVAAHAATKAAKDAADAQVVTLTSTVAEKDGLLVSARAGQTQPFTFKMNGTETQDFAAIQAHVEVLETFRTESIQSARTGYVEQLAAQGKITNPQKESFSNLALGMSQEQFELFKAGYDAAPGKSGIFGTVPTFSGGGATPPAPSGDNPVQAKIDILRETVASHQRSGMSLDELKTKPSYIELQSLIVTQTNA